MQLVHTKKSVVDRILDHFEIQIENPLVVLTQDKARSFMADSSAQDKYTFFLRGTLLANLIEDYDAIKISIDSIIQSIARKKEMIQELEDAYNRAKQRAALAEKAVELHDKLSRVKDELTWCYVFDAEKDLMGLTEDLEREKRRVERIKGKITEQSEL